MDVLKPFVAPIITEQCFTSLLVDFNFADQECLKLIVSKVLGYGIVAGSLIYKLPQIIKIISGKSVQGLSISMYLLELIGFVITLCYNYVNGYPFSTYGEYLFMTIQNVFILWLFFFFDDQYKRKAFLWSGLLAAAVGASLYVQIDTDLGVLSDAHREWLITATIPIFSLSRIPQIWTNFKTGSCGQLSLITCMLQVFGSAGRVFTTLQEVDNPILLFGFLAGLVLNAVLFLQVLCLPGAKLKKE